MTEKSNSRMSKLSRRDLLKGAMATGLATGLVQWKSPWKLNVPEPVFEQSATFQFPEEEKSWNWTWRVHTPESEVIILAEGKSESAETLILPLHYPFQSTTIHGEYSYWLELTGAKGISGRTEPVHIRLTPYRFGC